MSEAVHTVVQAALEKHGLAQETLEGLASHLLWRLGRSGDDGPIVVRVGFAGSAALFAELPRLKNATDAELELALLDRKLRVEWVGPRSS